MDVTEALAALERDVSRVCNMAAGLEAGIAAMDGVPTEEAKPALSELMEDLSKAIRELSERLQATAEAARAQRGRRLQRRASR
jgi:hypothetical protein